MDTNSKEFYKEFYKILYESMKEFDECLRRLALQ